MRHGELRAPVTHVDRLSIERLLYRLSISAHADAFVLNGATLFALWLGKPHRATKDLRGSPDIDRLVAVLREVAAIACPEDGIVFEIEDVVGAPIREDAVYAGVRVVVPGQPRSQSYYSGSTIPAMTRHRSGDC